MLTKKFGSMKKLAKKVKSINGNNEPSNSETFFGGDSGCSTPSAASTPTGTFPLYVGECRQRFVVPTSYLSHPLFKIVLEKAYNEYGFNQRNGLVVPCSVAAFQEVIDAIRCSNPKFDFGELVEEFIWLRNSFRSKDFLAICTVIVAILARFFSIYSVLH